MNVLRARNATLVGLVEDELSSFFRALDFRKPEQVRDALMDFVPLLVGEYGKMAGAVAAEWYEETMRANGVQVASATIAPNPISKGAMRANVRWNAAEAFGDNPHNMLGAIMPNVVRYVKQQGRGTQTRLALRDGMRYARIPKGQRTCAFCMMLAGRAGDWLYKNRYEAGDTGKGFGDRFHNDCNCEVTAVRDVDDYPEGFDIEQAYEMYDISASATGAEYRNNPEAILADMRRRWSDSLTDGVADDVYLATH